MTTAIGTIKHNNWDEKTYYEARPLKGNLAHIDAVFDGDLQGQAKTVFCLSYGEDDKSAHYAGHLLFKGTLAGRQGTFVIFEQGHWDDGVATSDWTIVEGSGTGGLKGLAGTGRYAAEHDKSVHYSLDYNFN
ncbi:DUF3224 domain-containing protein [Devosia sp.]|uniref:DUF3224 domain-containing protein n=1 Tax=Devosia sp. TaxID=1871048 RepID=UPI002FC7E19A